MVFYQYPKTAEHHHIQHATFVKAWATDEHVATRFSNLSACWIHGLQTTILFDICAGCFFYGFQSETLICVVAWKSAILRFQEENKDEYEILLNIFWACSKKKAPEKLHLTFFTKKISTVIFTKGG